MATGWEVLDTAVKIGLGAAITGGVSLWASGRQLKAQSAQDLRKQRQQEWTRSMELLVSFRKSLYLFNEESGDYLVNRLESELESKLGENLEAAKSRLEASFLDLLEAHTRLGILDPSIAGALESYRQAADEYFRDVWNRKAHLSDDELADLWGRLEEPQDQLFDGLRTFEKQLDR
jgi:hypothetical protein